MSERSFRNEVTELRKGEGDLFEGEGILAITKALLQSGVSYLGGYQGAPVSHLMDVMLDAEELLDEYGIHFEICASESAAAALCAASINYPMRGSVVWKSTVGTNVASDALSNLASAGVTGGVVIILGEDYGEGSSIIQERSHAFATKSTMWLVDPRPDHTRMADLIEQSFELSEVSNTPVMAEFRIRACHMTGSFETKDNKIADVSKNQKLTTPINDPERICLPPATYAQEIQKFEHRLPAALDYIKRNKMNEVFAGDVSELGIICQGGLYNSLVCALEQSGLTDESGASRIPIYCMNVTYPLVPDEIYDFARGKKSLLVVEEGHPDYLEQAIASLLRKKDIQTPLTGKGPLPMVGEYTIRTMLKGLSTWLEELESGIFDAHQITQGEIGSASRVVEKHIADAVEIISPQSVPPRPPTFCTGCPERPLFSAIKILERETGPIHIASDIGCNTFATLAPFHLGNSVLGYGMSMASSAAVNAAFDKPTITIMGDGGFWHNGLASGIAGAVYNKQDQVLVVLDNGYSSATGQQLIPSSVTQSQPAEESLPIEQALKGVGVGWIRTLDTYKVGDMVKLLREAMKSGGEGLKAVVARAECQLARQRRIKPQINAALKAGKRVVRTQFGVDEDVCTGDHSCIRLSGCPSLTLKDNPNPLRSDPVVSVDTSCVGCGNCGEVADAAVLCPSFYKLDIIQNANGLDRMKARWRDYWRGKLQNWELRQRRKRLKHIDEVVS